MEWLLWAYRQAFWCKRRLCPGGRVERIQIPANKLPWFWIGAEMIDRTETVTDMVNQYVQYGNRVTPEFLRDVTGYLNVKSWKYVDVETLEEREFPSDGFVIENVA